MKTIQIIGGGLAGLSLGILLRREGIPVSIIEAGRYPRHRVCGEFISGQGRRVLQELGLETELLARGASEARTAAFYSGKGRPIPRQLPEPALCVSRHTLDCFLAEKFCETGGELKVGERWRGEYVPGVVQATGHGSARGGNGWRWIGLKVHARGLQLDADLEMHLVDNGYVGLCRLNHETTNVCGLFRRREAAPNLATTWRQWLEGQKGSALQERLASATYDDGSFCATAGLVLGVQRSAYRPECRVGDSITMIAPMTGNGMSMALESAQAATGELKSYSEDRLIWEEAKKNIAKKCDQAFSRRLFWGRQLQRAAFCGAWKHGAVWAGMHSGFLWRELFQRTR